MRILDSEIKMQAKSSKVSREKEIEKLTYTENGKKKTIKNDGEGVKVDLSQMAKELLDAENDKEKMLTKEDLLLKVKKEREELVDRAKMQQINALGQKEAVVAFDKNELTVRLFEGMMENTLGKKFKMQRFSQTSFEQQLTRIETSIAKLEIAQQAKNSKANTASIHIEYERSYERYEKETMSFSSKGIIRTADGKEITLQLELNMSRTFYEKSHLKGTFSATGELMIDPLVINYAGSSADLTESKFSFDIDADGTNDQISFLKPGSGFLALDKNGDNTINDGSELFGTKSGDGFKDLATYDSDGNGWIDEGDQVFDKLRIWTKNSQGDDVLIGLGEVGIGAIFLGNVNSQFGLVGNQGNQNGQIAKTGIFLRENGTAGTMQHVDLSI